MRISRQIGIHILIILGIALYPLLFRAGEMLSFHHEFRNPYDFYTVFLLIFLIGVVYLNYYWLIPRWYQRNQKITYLSVLFLILLIYLSVFFLFEYKPDKRNSLRLPTPAEQIDNPDTWKRPDFKRHHRHFHKPPVVIRLSQALFLLIIGTLSGLYLRLKKDLETLTSEKQLAELAYMKAQINPHFQFNILNSIYALAIREQAPKTADSMLKLSGMMRYVVSEAHNPKVSLKRELDYISDYIELQKLRLDQSVVLNYLVEALATDEQITPLLLIPFIENAFKHGVNPDIPSEIDIRIRLKNTYLEMWLSNPVVATSKSKQTVSGYGLLNTRRRMELLYPGKHQLELIENENLYKVYLSLDLS